MGQRCYHRIAREGTLARALIARLRLVERIALTPEGIPAERACRATDIAIGLGLPVLNFSFHSPSLRPGNTPYVRSAAELDLFYRWWDIVLDQIGRAHVWTPVTNAQLVCRLLLDKKQQKQTSK